MRASELGPISLMSLDGRKEIQSEKSSWSVCIYNLNPASEPLLIEIIKEVKRTDTHTCVRTYLHGK